MKHVAIVGSRKYEELLAVDRIVGVLQGREAVVVSGGAPGVDKRAVQSAKKIGVQTLVFEADWSVGRHAGILRNKLIVDKADIVIAFWDGESKGTRDSIERAIKTGKRLHIIPPMHEPTTFAHHLALAISAIEQMTG